MNRMSATSQPVLEHRQQDVVRDEEAEVDKVVGVGVGVDVVVLASLKRRQDSEEAFDGSGLVTLGAGRDAGAKACKSIASAKISGNVGNQRLLSARPTVPLKKFVFMA